MYFFKQRLVLLGLIVLIFTSCEPTYDEMVFNSLELLTNKTWTQTSAPCFSDSTSYSMTVFDDYSGYLQITSLQYNNSTGGVELETQRINGSWWQGYYYQPNGLFTLTLNDNYDFQILSVSEDKLVFIDDYDCICELK